MKLGEGTPVRRRAGADKRGDSEGGLVAVIERDPDTGLLVGYVPGFAGAHSQGATMDELDANLREVIELMLEDGERWFITLRS
jgi:predicted RNase H-like HicB family nuclease